MDNNLLVDIRANPHARSMRAGQTQLGGNSYIRFVDGGEDTLSDSPARRSYFG